MENKLTHETLYYGNDMFITTEEEGKISFQRYDKKGNPKNAPIKFYGKFDFNILKYDLLDTFKKENRSISKEEIESYVNEQKKLGNANYMDIIFE